MNAIILDLDDTLILEWQSARDAFAETIHSFKTEINKDIFIETIREEAKNLWYGLPTIEYCLKIRVSSWEALWADFEGNDENIQQFRQLSGEYRQNVWHNALKKFNISDPHIAYELAEKFKNIRNLKHALFPDTILCLE